MMNNINTIEDLDAVLGEMFDDPVKDRAWLNKALDMLDTSPELDDLYFIKRSLNLHICGWCHEYYEELHKNKRVADTLYVMSSNATNTVKIGRTHFDVQARASQLRVGCPDIKVVAAFDGEGWREPYIHRMLAASCVGGEWFSISPNEAVEIIKAEMVSRGFGEPL